MQSLSETWRGLRLFLCCHISEPSYRQDEGEKNDIFINNNNLIINQKTKNNEKETTQFNESAPRRSFAGRS